VNKTSSVSSIKIMLQPYSLSLKVCVISENPPLLFKLQQMVYRARLLKLVDWKVS